MRHGILFSSVPGVLSPGSGQKFPTSVRQYKKNRGEHINMDQVPNLPQITSIPWTTSLLLKNIFVEAESCIYK